MFAKKKQPTKQQTWHCRLCHRRIRFSLDMICDPCSLRYNR